MQQPEDNNDPHNVSVCSDEPKPATGEWTVERLREYLSGYSSYELRLRAMSKLINAEKAKYAALTGSSDEVIEIDEKGKITKPKPATVVEWTDLYVLELLGNPKNQGWSLHPDRIKSLIDAHNAALAAERENFGAAVGNRNLTNQQLREQLAARDLLVKQLEQDIEAKERQCDETYAELAALEGVLADDTGKSALDAAIAEATKPLVELIKTAIRCGRGLGSEWRDKAKIATQDWTDRNPLKLPASYREQSAAGEWTAERIHSYKCDGDLIEDINAAIAAEREKHKQAVLKWGEASTKLAAAEQKVRVLTDQMQKDFQRDLP